MRKIIPVIAGGAVVVALAGSAVGYATADKAVTLSVDGQPQEVQTTAGTVGDLLESRGIAVGEHDVVAPAPSAKLVEGTRVAVRFGREVRFSVDGKPQTIWTTATTVDEAVGALGLDTSDAQLSTSRSAAIGREGLDVSVATEKKVVITVGKKRRTLTTHAQTVGAALADAKFSVDGDDLVKPAASRLLTSGTKIKFTDVVVRTVRRTEAVAYSTTRKKSDKLARGQTRVERKGVTGSKRVSYRVVRHNGKVVKKTVIASSTTKRAVARVLIVGTKAPKTAPSVASGGVWDRLAQCEAGGNWSINTGNGFYGGLQFTLSTWRGYGGSGMPHHASREQQIAIAKKVQAGQGWGAWPACTRKLGIR